MNEYDGMERVEVDAWDTVLAAIDRTTDDLGPGDEVDMHFTGTVEGGYFYRRAGKYLLDDGAVRLLVIPGTSTNSLDTGHGDYLGLSNLERLREDYGDYVVHVRGGAFGDECLAVIVGSDIPRDLADAIDGLRHYPVYDEQDYGEREWAALMEWSDKVITCASMTLADELDRDADDLEAVARDYMPTYAEGESLVRAEDLDERRFTDALREHLAGK